jgi:thiamine pyrophosphate-dependent acetolactate synthase large subunit-like protein
MYQARSGRPRPTAIAVPWDVLGATAPVRPVPPIPVRPPDLDPAAITRAADLLAAARNPMIMVGRGARDAAGEVAELARLLQAPVVSFRGGRGIVDDDDPLGFTCVAGFRRWADTDVLLGTLGFGYPTSLGVKAAFPDRAVVSIAGDGGFMFGIGELATAVQHDLGVVAVVFNNGAFGNVLLDQQRLYEGREVGARLRNPDFAAVAEAFGAAGYRAGSPQALQAALTKALADGRPAVIEVSAELGGTAQPWKYLMPR